MPTLNGQHKSFLAFSCVHRPIHDPAGTKWLVSQIRKYRPDVLINLGDLFDAAALSEFDKGGEEADLEEEYESAGEFLAQIHSASPKSKLVWMEGNHEQRIRRVKWKKLTGVLDYRKRIEEARRWKHYPYRYSPDGIFTLGQVSFYHGFCVGRNTVKSESVKLGVPYGLTVSGHTHRPFPVHRISMGVTPLPYWMVNPGTFIKDNVDYMETKDDSLWGQGVVTGWANTRRRNEGRQCWHAELVLNHMAWDVGGAA